MKCRPWWSSGPFRVSTLQRHFRLYISRWQSPPEVNRLVINVCRCGSARVYAQQTDWSIPGKIIPSGTPRLIPLWLFVESKKHDLFTLCDLERSFRSVISKVDPPTLSTVLPYCHKLWRRKKLKNNFLGVFQFCFRLAICSFCYLE